LQIEHIVPRAKLGSNRVSNLCLACEKCNTRKGTKDIKDFLKKKPDLLNKILAQAKVPLKNAGTHEGRMSARAKGGFKIATRLGTITDVGKNYCRKLQRADGYGFSHLRVPLFHPYS